MKISPEIYIKYTPSGPNYHYYPTTLAFQTDVSVHTIIKKLKKVNRNEGNLNTIVHIPFCQDPDCYSTAHQIKLENNNQLTQYIETLMEEISIYKNHLNKINISEIHFSGNETSILAVYELEKLLDSLVASFKINLKETIISIEVNARLSDRAILASLKQMGFNSLKISTLNFDYNLQTSNGTIQSFYQADQLIQDAKQLGFDAVNVELLYGLPGESIESMKKTIDGLTAMKCEQICLSHYIHRPYIFKLQKQMNQLHMITVNESFSTFNMCLESLLSSGYEHLGMNSFILHGSQLHVAKENNKLNYNHTGYTSNTVNDVVSFGATSISYLDGLYYQNMIGIDDYYKAVEQGLIPVNRGCSLDSEQLFRKKIINNLIVHKRCHFSHNEINQLNLLEYIDETCSKLHDMENDGLVLLSENSIQITELGQYFLKNICDLFDLNMMQLILYEA